MAFKTMISNLGNQSSLSITHQNIENEDCNCISQALKGTQIADLNLSNNNIGEEGVKYLAEVLKETQITNLNLGNNHIGDGGVKYLAEVLKDTQIKSLDVSQNNIGFDGALYLNQILGDTKISLLKLDVHYTINGRAQYIRVSLCDKSSVTLHGNKLGTNSARYLNQMFQNIPIYNLKLDSQSIDDAGALYLSQAFKNVKIINLRLRKQQFQQRYRVQYLIQAFKDSQIVQLDISSEKIGEEGAENLASFLKEIKIIELHATYNFLRDEGVKYLASALKNNTIMYLDLTKNYIKADGARYLAEILLESQITYIGLCNNQIGPEGARHLASGLRCSQVTGIHLHGNEIQSEGYQYLLDVIDDTNVSWSNLNGNCIVDGSMNRPSSIPRNTVSTAERIRDACKEVVSLNPQSNEIEFIVPKKDTYILDVNRYPFLIKTLMQTPKAKVHVIDILGRTDFDIINKMNEFVTVLPQKFNSFINNNLPEFVERFDGGNFPNLVKEFEDIREVVQNLLLHRELYYVDENRELLHPYIYKMLNKYKMPLYSEQLEADKKEKIISYYQDHLEIDGAQELLDLLKSESFGKTDDDI